ncbi:glycosyltransferase family 2 protein [uncultured Gelidibacter sp.]|uniref:glycosyltransferase family 2 protein n=1 Tax=uncultured Gelidibacter sp. TaxID=259318 RepID=UPI0026305489|nr:glycosyltransferase family 2 protein [uncultured Gelidibacter sp.]
MNEPLVSVIIPTYNRAHLILETIQSVVMQSYNNWECLVIDDGSTDNTRQIVNECNNKDKRIKYFIRPPEYKSGGNGARNYGFKISQGDFIQWFDDDDVMLSDFIEQKINVFDFKTNFVIGLGNITDDKLNTVAQLSFDKDMSLYRGLVLWKTKIITGCVMFKKTFLEGESLFNENILRGQETEFFSRLFFKCNKNDYILVEAPLFLYRQHGLSKTTQNVKYNVSFKTSEIYIALENLKQSILLNDRQLFQFFYKVLINFLFRAVQNGDSPNAHVILNELVPILKKNNKALSYQINIASRMFLILGCTSYKVEMYFKNYPL